MQETFYSADHVYRQHRFSLPLDHDNPTAGEVTVFAREVVSKSQRDNKDLPWLVYLQGGPGFPSPRPSSHSGWLKRALEEYRVLLLDQRGTGLSTVISHQTLATMTPQAQADYLVHFRADSIVRDAEAIRVELGVEKWSILGQSFGGFCALTYLSFYPESLSAAFITGGIPSISRPADDVYQATYRQLIEKQRAFFNAFPAAQGICARIANHLLKHETRLPNGQIFTVEQFQLIGINLGRSEGGRALYYLVVDAFVSVNGQETLSYSFLNTMLAQQSYLTNPIYAILHESIYCQNQASNWSAHRVRCDFPQCNYTSDGEFWFTGEMVYPWMFDQLETLKPLKEAADILAAKQDWSALYDGATLAQNRVPVAAAVYVEDMYVEFEFSRETLASMPNAKAWMTNEYEHNGLGADGERILDRLIAMTEEIQDIQALNTEHK
ncbi:MAG: alpha/beta fold hydrolase [Myxococcota bacterium]|nr:alpha/beta fold hydrolase [Myxococcota bacterium]